MFEFIRFSRICWRLWPFWIYTIIWCTVVYQMWFLHFKLLLNMTCFVNLLINLLIKWYYVSRWMSHKSPAMCLMERISVAPCADWTPTAFLSKLVRAAEGQSVTGSDLLIQRCRRLRNRLTSSPRLLKTPPKRKESFKGLKMILVFKGNFKDATHPAASLTILITMSDFRSQIPPFFPEHLKSTYLTVWTH